jgi:hypothetical protein
MIPYIKPADEPWAKDHNMAIIAPVGVEVPLTSMIDGWIKYPQRYHGLYHRDLEDNPGLACQWALIGRTIQILLDGPTGRLDGDSLKALIFQKLGEHGFSSD